LVILSYRCIAGNASLGVGAKRVVNKQLKVFITYSHKNTAEKDELITRLILLKGEGLISIWHDNEILPGDKWRDAIFDNLADSDLLLYLTSAHSLASENCNKELATALNAEMRVIPIILESCDWQSHQLSDFQALPDRGVPVDEWQPESKGWQNVVEGIRNTISKLQSQTDPSSEISKEELHSELMCQHGHILMMLGEPDMAIEAYSSAIDLNPCKANAYLDRGNAYHDRGELEHAIKDYSKAIELNPDYADAYSNRGNAYRDKGKLNEAMQDYNTAIKLKSDHHFIYNNRGNVYRDKGKLNEAMQDYNTAIELNPDFADAYNGRGNVYFLKDDFDNAIEEYNMAIKLAPDDALPYNNRGNLYLRKGELEQIAQTNPEPDYRRNAQFDRAIEDYSKAVELDPDYAKAYCNRGTVYREIGEFHRAIEDFNKAIELNPDLVLAYYNRGQTWLNLHEWEKARADLTIANDKRNLTEVSPFIQIKN